jgi:hypothetical protein
MVAWNLDLSKGRFMFTNATVRTLLRYVFDRNLAEKTYASRATLFSSAFGIQIISGPGWMTNERLDVALKVLVIDSIQKPTQN